MLPHRAAIYIVLGQIYLLANKDSEARATLEKAQRAVPPGWRTDHPELGILDGALGVLAMRERRWLEAEACLRRAFDSLEALFGPGNREAGMVLKQLAIALKHQKRKDESRQALARAREMLDVTSFKLRVSAWSFREIR